MTIESGEQDLVRRAVGGEARAFDRLVEIYTPRLYRVIRRTAPDRGEAEAVVQEAWLRAWKHRKRCAPDRPFFPWLASIALNAARDTWRKRRPLDFADLGDAVEGMTEAEVSAEAQLEASEARRQLVEYIDELRPEWRMVLALRYDGGLEYSEIATVLGIPPNTVRTHLRRAKAALRARLEAGHAGTAG
jgi:RNA polymerase sigma-70 factor (ECF subfamily)